MLSWMLVVLSVSGDVFYGVWIDVLLRLVSLGI